MAGDVKDDSRGELDELIDELSERDPAFEASLADARARTSLLKALVRTRKNADLTQHAVAERMGTTQSAVSEFEGGTADPRLSTLQRYARAVGTSLIVETAPADHVVARAFNDLGYARSTVLNATKPTVRVRAERSSGDGARLTGNRLVARARIVSGAGRYAHRNIEHPDCDSVAV